MKIRSKMGMVFLLAGLAVAGLGGGTGPKSADEGGLRVRMDEARGRLWVLRLKDVSVYDAATKTLISRVRLRNWLVARFYCPPDLAIDGNGDAIVSSNVQSRLWRIDARDFRVQEQRIRLEGRELWDVGFGALAFTSDGRLYAVTALTATLWSIDTRRQRARMVGPANPFSKTCELTPRLVREIEMRHAR